MVVGRIHETRMATEQSAQADAAGLRALDYASGVRNCEQQRMGRRGLDCSRRCWTSGMVGQFVYICVSPFSEEGHGVGGRYWRHGWICCLARCEFDLGENAESGGG